MTLTFGILSFQLSKSEQQLEACLMLHCLVCLVIPFGSFWVDYLSKLTIDLEDDIDLNKRSHLRRIHVLELVGLILFFTILQYK